jgi:hypothetical protein
MGSDRIKQMRQRIFERFPKVKEAYRKQLESDPALATDAQKWQAFLRSMQEKGLLPAFGGMGPGGRGR